MGNAVKALGAKRAMTIEVNDAREIATVLPFSPIFPLSRPGTHVQQPRLVPLEQQRPEGHPYLVRVQGLEMIP